MDGSKKPYFSVIIPLYNKAGFIQNTLKTVLGQTFSDFEVIIIDDGSTDQGLEVLSKIKDRRMRVFCQENKGVSVARNAGINLAKGEYICFLDADDEWRPRFLEEIYAAAQHFPDERIFAAAVEIEACGIVLPAVYSLKNEVHPGIFIENYFEASRNFSVLWTSAAAFHHSVFQMIGIFDTTIKSGQDTDLWIRMAEKFRIVFINSILARYKEHVESLSRNTKFKNMPKIHYNKFRHLEGSRPEAKIFLDLNRYSEVLTLKINGHHSVANSLKNDISLENLPVKKRILLYMPSFVLRFLLSIQPILIRAGIRKTYFK